MRAADEVCEVDVVHLDAVQAVRAAMPANQGIARIAETLSLLSNPTRLRMLLALGCAEPPARRELCVCDLAVVAGASKSMTSHQLRLLRTAGLVVPRRSGKLVYYRLAEGSAVALLGDAIRLALESAP